MVFPTFPRLITYSAFPDRTLACFTNSEILQQEPQTFIPPLCLGRFRFLLSRHAALTLPYASKPGAISPRKQPVKVPRSRTQCIQGVCRLCSWVTLVFRPMLSFPVISCVWLSRSFCKPGKSVYRIRLVYRACIFLGTFGCRWVTKF